ncbi:MAG: serine hydrolase domain-containing protein [Actinomycetota bacterium]
MPNGHRRSLAVVLTAGLLVAACGDGSSAEAPVETSVPTTQAPTTTASPTTTGSPASTTPSPVDGVAVEDVVGTALQTASGTTALADRMVELNVPGVAVAVVVDGSVVTSFAVGSTPTGQPMATDTIVQVASVSKPVAALTALSLAASGAIDLDADVEAALTSYTLPAGAQTGDNPVTISGLLAHGAGTNVDGYLGYAEATDAPTRPEVLAGGGNAAAGSVVQPPGSSFLYSGGGYELMAQTLVDITGQDFASLVARAVLEPAGMDDSFYALELDDSRAVQASEGSIGGQALDNRWQAHPEQAAAGLWTTVDDLGALLAAFSRSLLGDDSGVVAPATARLAVTPTLSAEGIGATAQGFFVDDFESPTRWFHNGRNIGYTAEIAGAIDGSYAVAVVTNSFPGGTDLAREIIATVEATIEDLS